MDLKENRQVSFESFWSKAAFLVEDTRLRKAHLGKGFLVHILNSLELTELLWLNIHPRPHTRFMLLHNIS